MAGIAGIIIKGQSKQVKDNALSFKQMLQKLVYDANQISDTIHQENVLAGNAMPVGVSQNTHHIKSERFPYHVFLDGVVFVDKEEKKMLEEHYKIKPLKNDYHYLPCLYDHYGDELGLQITGWFNIFIYNEKEKKHLLINDRLGFYPLYYYEDETVFAFSSKIESIIASGLLPEIHFDETTFAEHLLFHYPLTDHTYIQDVYTLAHATLASIGQNITTYTKYWNANEFFDKPPLNKKESIETLNFGLEKAINKFLLHAPKTFNFSLTGGWDSRVVLSYLLPEHKDRINAYSFGAPGADDITIPEYIAKQEEFKYTPFALDQKYLKRDFLTSAEETIRLSNGTRNYKRTHYVHAIKNIASKSPHLLTGIFGDEVFKTGKPQGGTVISPLAVRLLELNFNEEELLEEIKGSWKLNVFNTNEQTLAEQLKQRLAKLRKEFTQYKTSGQRYFAFRFLVNLRKYFGNEANSYNDFVYCYSPFIDYDFLKAFAATKYMISRYGFTEPSLKQKAQSSWLYYKLTNLNYKPLAKYQSSRGFSMEDTNTITGLPKVLFNKIIKKKLRKNADDFNTRNTDQMFTSLLKRTKMPYDIPFSSERVNNISSTDLNSLLYWTCFIEKNYNL